MDQQNRTIAIVGGGFAGAYLAIGLARARQRFRIILIEREKHAGRGLAYGACDTFHLLNVPVSRMELGLSPGFQEWLVPHTRLLSDALTEADGDPASAYVPRSLFGDYLEERLLEQAKASAGNLSILRGEATGLLEDETRGVLLADGRKIRADILVLATGNNAPVPPSPQIETGLFDSDRLIRDPWADGSLDEIAPDKAVLLIGTGLTMVDVALSLKTRVHKGRIHALSRHGLLPFEHMAGGNWPSFLGETLHSPSKLMRLIRQQARKASMQGVPWQRVMDTVRPHVAHIWSEWNIPERESFLRHARTHWDVHRHRMAPRVASVIRRMRQSGQLTIEAARILSYAIHDVDVEVTADLRDGSHKIFRVGHVVNCTGPRSDFDRLGTPIFANLRRRRMISADRLALGLETSNGAVVDPFGEVSPWIFAVGALTRPAWWEITAVPEIAVQINKLVETLSRSQPDSASADTAGLASAFRDIGAGI